MSGSSTCSSMSRVTPPRPWATASTTPAAIASTAPGTAASSARRTSSAPSSTNSRASSRSHGHGATSGASTSATAGGAHLGAELGDRPAVGAGAVEHPGLGVGGERRQAGDDADALDERRVAGGDGEGEQRPGRPGEHAPAGDPEVGGERRGIVGERADGARRVRVAAAGAGTVDGDQPDPDAPRPRRRRGGGPAASRACRGRTARDGRRGSPTSSKHRRRPSASVSDWASTEAQRRATAWPRAAVAGSFGGREGA